MEKLTDECNMEWAGWLRTERVYFLCCFLHAQAAQAAQAVLESHPGMAFTICRSRCPSMSSLAKVASGTTPDCILGLTAQRDAKICRASEY